MQTTCPECRTTFRVSQEQLGVRRGLVRCGHCGAVFNAYDTLLPELADAPAPEMDGNPAGVIEEPPLPEVEVASLRQQALFGRAPDDGGSVADPDTGRSAAARAPDDDALSVPTIDFQVFGRESAPAERPQVAPPRPPESADEPWEKPERSGWRPPSEDAPGAGDGAAGGESAEAILLSQLPTRRISDGGRPARRWQALRFVLAALLVMVLLAQFVYFLRAELVARVPASRAPLTAACAWLGCRLPLPAGLDDRAIEASSLEHDAERKSRVRLTVLIANRADQAQSWPHLVLSLSDVHDRPVARKRFAPDVYLPAGTLVEAGLAAGGEREIRLDLDIGNLSASGYRLSLVYP